MKLPPKSGKFTLPVHKEGTCVVLQQNMITNKEIITSKALDALVLSCKYQDFWYYLGSISISCETNVQQSALFIMS